MQKNMRNQSQSTDISHGHSASIGDTLNLFQNNESTVKRTQQEQYLCDKKTPMEQFRRSRRKSVLKEIS